MAKNEKSWSYVWKVVQRGIVQASVLSRKRWHVKNWYVVQEKVKEETGMKAKIWTKMWTEIWDNKRGDNKVVQKMREGFLMKGFEILPFLIKPYKTEYDYNP